MDKLSVAVVFDRKKELAKGKKVGKVEVRITVNRVVKYWLCSFKLEKNQWDGRNQRVKNSTHSEAFNGEISTRVDKVFAYYTKIAQEGLKWDFDAFWRFTEGKNDENFIAFSLRRIEERTDITESTKKSQRSQYVVLQEYGKIQLMSDITYENIVRYSEWLQKKYTKNGKVQQGTVWTRLKCIKHYVKEACNFDLIDRNPFDKFKIDKGESEGAEILMYEDFLKMMSAPIPHTLEKVRDILAVQFYTGLSIVDLRNADFTRLEQTGDYLMLTGERQKTHQPYYIPVMEECLAILERHNFVLPMISDQQLNMRYRMIAECAGVKYHISSHSLRKGCATYLINKGVSLEVIAKVMGHSTTIETQKIYAKLKKETIANEVACKINAT